MTKQQKETNMIRCDLVHWTVGGDLIYWKNMLLSASGTQFHGGGWVLSKLFYHQRSWSSIFFEKLDIFRSSLTTSSHFFQDLSLSSAGSTHIG